MSSHSSLPLIDQMLRDFQRHSEQQNGATSQNLPEAGLGQGEQQQRRARESHPMNFPMEALDDSRPGRLQGPCSQKCNPHPRDDT